MKKKKTKEVIDPSLGMRLKNFSSLEQNLWWNIVTKIRDKGLDSNSEEKLIITKSEIENISNYRFTSGKEFFDEMLTLSHKIVGLDAELTEGNTVIIFALFPWYKVSKDKVEIKVSEYFNSWIKKLQGSFRQEDLQILLELNNNYTKELYRFLMTQKNKEKYNSRSGIWNVKLSTFKQLMGLPKSYGFDDLDSLIFNQAKKELLTQDEEGWAPLKKLNIKQIYDSNDELNRLVFDFEQSISKSTKLLQK